MRSRAVMQTETGGLIRDLRRASALLRIGGLTWATLQPYPMAPLFPAPTCTWGVLARSSFIIVASNPAFLGQRSHRGPRE